MSTYFARDGSVFVIDGPWEARLEPRQCDRLLTIWNDANAVTLFNALWQAMKEAGLEPSTFARPRLTLVSDYPAQEVVRRMLRRGVEALEVGHE